MWQTLLIIGSHWKPHNRVRRTTADGRGLFYRLLNLPFLLLAAVGIISSFPSVPYKFYEFPEFPYPSHLVTEEYPSGETVLEYTRSYARHFQVGSAAQATSRP